VKIKRFDFVNPCHRAATPSGGAIGDGIEGGAGRELPGHRDRRPLGFGPVRPSPANLASTPNPDDAGAASMNNFGVMFWANTRVVALVGTKAARPAVMLAYAGRT
jgi:hypothetical protein